MITACINSYCTDCAEVGEPVHSLPELLRFNSRTYGAKPAVHCDGMASLSHAALWDQVTAIVATLNKFGVGRGDRVAIVLPQGPELAVAFLAVACGATAAPLNPAYLKTEVEFYLKDLQAKTLILEKNVISPAREAADALGIPVLELETILPVAGRFELCSMEDGTAEQQGWAEAGDTALVLHTSGTTSKPKRVPLAHVNLCASQRHIGSALRLCPEDRCLNVMPLFHIHGLVACLLASLGSGGSVVCPRGFDASRFSTWLSEWQPTWYSAVPTMHQAILAQGMPSEKSSSLRFVRSSSASLPPTVMAALEATFSVPVIEAYGMTEAAHQMASNQLPPGVRKPGSVGCAAGPEIVVLDAAGEQLQAGGVGEVAIRGVNVTTGYEDNPAGNAEAFQNGWFRTGDQGYLDADGFLFLTGRLKEIINRGGEKIAPREIDEALLAHPLVRQAVAFGVPHISLGEDVAAAVVLCEGAECSEAELRGFLLEKLPVFKAPSRIVIVTDIPKGPTGKIQRIGLAARLQEALAVPFQPPSSGLEELVAEKIREVLGSGKIGRHDNFFMLGGDSLRAAQVLARLSNDLALTLPPPMLFRLPTPALLAAELMRLQSDMEINNLAELLQGLGEEERARLLNEESK